jgi:hypothetical protein
VGSPYRDDQHRGKEDENADGANRPSSFALPEHPNDERDHYSFYCPQFLLAGHYLPPDIGPDSTTHEIFSVRDFDGSFVQGPLVAINFIAKIPYFARYVAGLLQRCKVRILATRP